MIHPVQPFVSSWLLLGAVALAASLPEAPPSPARPAPVGGDLDAIASLPGFGGREDRQGPPCLYGEVPGMQVLSLLSGKETRDFVHDLEIQRFLLGQMLPEALRAPFSAPVLFILEPPAATGPSGANPTNPNAVRTIAAGQNPANVARLVVEDLDVIAVLRGTFPLDAILNGASSALPVWTRIERGEYLNQQIAHDLYFVEASAYDYNPFAQGGRKLIWRTTMTVGARGVAMTETLSPLIASAAPYFGREMTEPELTSRQVSRAGRIEIGPLTTMGTSKNEQKPATLPPTEAPSAKP